MKLHPRALPLVFYCLLTASCSQRPTELNAPRQIPGAGLLSDQGDGFALDGVVFQVSPMSVRICEHHDLRMSADVTWDAQKASAKTVVIWVGDGKSAPKKWLSGGATGHSQTGAWVGDNTSLRLADGSTDRTLALRHIHVTQCLDEPPVSAASSLKLI